MSEEMAGRTKCWTEENDKWWRKEYKKESNSGTIKDIITIRLHWCGRWKLTTKGKAWAIDSQCVRRGDYRTCLGINKGDKKFKLNEKRGKEWGEIVEIYRKNK